MEAEMELVPLPEHRKRANGFLKSRLTQNQD